MNSKAKKQSTKAKLVPLENAIKAVNLDLSDESQVGVVVDKAGKPEAFVFNTHGFLDFLSEIDERLVDKLSNENYHSPEVNIAGGLIDEIESRLPVSEAHIESLKIAIEEAREKGWITFESIKNELAAN